MRWVLGLGVQNPMNCPRNLTQIQHKAVNPFRDGKWASI